MLKFFAEKMWVAFANIRILYIESAKTVNKMTLNDTLNNWTLAFRLVNTRKSCQPKYMYSDISSDICFLSVFTSVATDDQL